MTKAHQNQPLHHNRQPNQSGLSAPEPLVQLLAATPTSTAFSDARTHLKRDFDAMAPVFETLLRAYGQHLKAEWFGWEAFAWAAELWYAYSIQVRSTVSRWIW
jgi:hypothetical protein